MYEKARKRAILAGLDKIRGCFYDWEIGYLCEASHSQIALKTPKTMKHTISFLLLACSLLSCNRYLSDYIPTVDYRGLRIKSIEPQIDLQSQTVDAELLLQLAFRYSNPYKKPLRIPDHNFSVWMKNSGLAQGRELAHLAGTGSSFVVRPESDTVVQYLLRLDLDPLGQMKDFLGWDNVWEFRSLVTLDLKEYLPGGAIKQALSGVNTKREIPLVFSDSIRLPLPPVVRPQSGATARVAWLGQMESLDLKPLRDGMNPFVNLIKDTKVQVYAPTVSNPFRTVEVNFADHMMSLLTPVVPAADDTWDDFKDAWTDFKNQPVLEYPGPRVTGLRVTFPFQIYNPNHFPIESPEMDMSARLNSSYTPMQMEMDPSGSKLIGPLQNKTMTLSCRLNWNNTFTFQGLFSGQALPNNPTFSGNINVDIGYGMIRVPYSVVVPLNLGGQ